MEDLLSWLSLLSNSLSINHLHSGTSPNLEPTTAVPLLGVVSCFFFSSVFESLTALSPSFGRCDIAQLCFSYLSGFSTHLLGCLFLPLCYLAPFQFFFLSSPYFHGFDHYSLMEWIWVPTSIFLLHSHTSSHPLDISIYMSLLYFKFPCLKQRFFYFSY